MEFITAALHCVGLLFKFIQQSTILLSSSVIVVQPRERDAQVDMNDNVFDGFVKSVDVLRFRTRDVRVDLSRGAVGGRVWGGRFRVKV